MEMKDLSVPESDPLWLCDLTVQCLNKLIIIIKLQALNINSLQCSMSRLSSLQPYLRSMQLQQKDGSHFFLSSQDPSLSESKARSEIYNQILNEFDSRTVEIQKITR